MSEHTPEKGGRSTHVVYRIGSDFSYQETPCFCSATERHAVDQTRPTSPEQRADQ